MKLLIVESPTKAKKIASLLGGDWRVKASVGHIRDLPLGRMGVSTKTYDPEYEIIDGKQAVIAELKREVASARGEVYLGTDPDREGEAISAHLESVLGLRDPKRVKFTAIEPAVINAALASPGRIDRNLVHAQEARRVLDRLEGFEVSGALKAKTGQQFTAGRTQSPGLRLVVEREEEIEAFVALRHFTVTHTFDAASGAAWTSTWLFKPFLAENETYWTDEEVAKTVAELRDFVVAARVDKEIAKGPPPPFTTSTLQQAGSARLRFGTKRTMDLAQRLHEKGAITYHATDSPNLSPEGLAKVRDYAKAAGFPLSPNIRKRAEKDSAQGGHEAIRPTHVELRDGRREFGLTDDEQKLYELIWKRTIASQLEDAKYARRSVTLEALERINGKLQGKKLFFGASGTTLISAGYQVIESDDSAKDPTDEAEASNDVPALDQGAHVRADRGECAAAKTKPPSRYTQATLVKKLEDETIGRPRTFASIVETILSREYVIEKKDGRTMRLFPTPAGKANMSMCRGHFRVAELAYTRQLEERFDAIARGDESFFDVVDASYKKLVVDLDAFKRLPIANLPSIVTGGACPSCAEGTLILRKYREKGAKVDAPLRTFWGCSNKSAGTCDQTYPDAGGKPNLAARAPRVEGGTCPRCNAHPVVRNENERGVWWSCRGWREGCKGSFPDVNGQPDLTFVKPPDGGPCPKCKSGRLLKRQGSKGPFWGCSAFREEGKKKCDTTLEDLEGQPNIEAYQTAQLGAVTCPKCNKGRLTKRTGAKGAFWGCSNFREAGRKKCSATFEDVDGKPDPGSSVWELARSTPAREPRSRSRSMRL